MERYQMLSCFGWKRKDENVEEGAREQHIRPTLEECLEYPTDEYWTIVLIVE